MLSLDFAVSAVLAANVTPKSHKQLVKEPHFLSEVCEAAPLVYKSRLLLMECMRPASGGRSEDYYLTLKDVEGDKPLAHFAEGYGLASALVHRGEVYVSASHWENESWNDVTVFHSRDLKTWESHVALRQEPGEHLFNTSVCAAGSRFVMAYETDDPKYVPFTIKFAESRDLHKWETIPGAIFGPDRYAACPALRYVDGMFYVLYLEHMKPAWRFETYLVRSRDLKEWEPSPRNPILAPEEGEDINTSDPDLAEFKGRTYLYYSIGDQRTYAKLKRAVYPGPMREFLKSYFPKGVPTVEFSARE